MPETVISELDTNVRFKRSMEPLSETILCPYQKDAGGQGSTLNSLQHEETLDAMVLDVNDELSGCDS